MNMTPPTPSCERFGKIIAALSLTLLCGTSLSRGDTFTWTGGGSDGNWNTAANWSGGTGVPDDATDTAVFNSGATTVTVNSNYTVNIDFQSGGWTLEGTGSFTLDSSVSLTNTSGTNTISKTLSIQNNNTVAVTSGSLVSSGVINYNSAINKNGSGTLILNSQSGTNTNSGLISNGGTSLFNYATPELKNFVQPQSASSGIIGGNGTITFADLGTTIRQLRALSSGVINPGGDGSAEGGDVIGTLTVVYQNTGTTNTNANNVKFFGGSTFHVDIDTVGNTSDLLDIQLGGSATHNGTIQMSNVSSNTITLELATLGLAPLDPGDSFTIASYATLPIEDSGATAQFNSITLNGVDITGDIGSTYYLNYNPTSLVFGMVPEPSLYATLAGLGILAAAIIHQRRK